jgi:hypothetical protein
MKYTVEMGSCAMIYIPSFIQIGSAMPKSIEGMHRHTQTAWRSHKPTSIFFSKYEKLANKTQRTHQNSTITASFPKDEIYSHIKQRNNRIKPIISPWRKILFEMLIYAQLAFSFG